MTAGRSGFMGYVMGRRWIVWTCVGLALVVLLASSLTVWVKRQALDTNNWVDVSSQLLQDPEVRQTVAADMVDGLFASSDVQLRLQQALPPRLDPLAAPATGLLRQAALNAANDLLQRPAVQSLWREANRRAHERLVGLLEGDTDRALQADNGDVVLDLQPLVQSLGDRLGFQVNLKNPEAGRITIMHSNQLQEAQDAVKAIKVLSVFAVIAVLVLLVLAVYLAEGFRREVLRATALGVIGVGMILLIVRRVAGNVIVNNLTSPSTRDAGSAVWLIGTDLLRDLALGLVLYGIVLSSSGCCSPGPPAGPPPCGSGWPRSCAPTRRSSTSRSGSSSS